VEGQVIKEGPPREIASDEVVRREYLGARFRMDTEVIRKRAGDKGDTAKVSS
jgi:hypothetical protein